VLTLCRFGNLRYSGGALENPKSKMSSSGPLPIGIPIGNFFFMEKLISIDEVGRTVLPKQIREAVNLGKGGPAKIRLVRGIIEIEPIAPSQRRLKKVGKFLVGVSDGTPRYDAAADVRAEREAR
jgi:bifunctional DNA-binding transcriptional regulator/antitoxin component of YhaV-PrlF toxin-antitoxin module